MGANIKGAKRELMDDFKKRSFEFGSFEKVDILWAEYWVM